VPLHPALDTTDWRLTVQLPHQLAAQVVPQGSITLDGISLTVARIDVSQPDLPRVEIAIIPHTYQSTNLRHLHPGAHLNMETDVLAKYVAAQRTPHEDWLTLEYLLARGY
jgi:riboflavin synthase